MILSILNKSIEFLLFYWPMLPFFYLFPIVVQHKTCGTQTDGDLTDYVIIEHYL